MFKTLKLSSLALVLLTASGMVGIAQAVAFEDDGQSVQGV